MMQARSLGVTALSLTAVAVALYGMVAGVALLFGGAIGAVDGSEAGVPILALGAVVFATGMAAFVVSYGFWAQTHWSWAGGLIVFSVMIVSIAVMAVLGARVTSLVFPIALAGGGIVYLLRPATRTALIGEDLTAPTPRSDATEVGAGSAF